MKDTIRDKIFGMMFLIGVVMCVFVIPAIITDANAFWNIAIFGALLVFVVMLYANIQKGDS